MKKKSLSTLDIAPMLGVAVGSVANWIDQNQLKAGRTPGGHRRVQVEDLVDFLRQQNLPIPAELVLTPKILVVDDEPAISTWVADEIKEQIPNCQVMVANDGFSAGELVGTMNPEVVILDLRMPELDGFEVCRRIKAKETTRNIIVIAMTSMRSSNVEKRILECGAMVCLKKPLDPAALMKEVTLALSMTGVRSVTPHAGLKVG
jgi:excisionase family DNA binding protein